MVSEIIAKANKLKQLIGAASTIAIVGHIRPDGDCVGSSLGLYNYINDNYPGKKVDVYIEAFSPEFMFLKGADKVRKRVTKGCYELAISVDCSDTDRHGAFGKVFASAITTVCIDHHISNKGFGELCYIDGGSSSACEAIIDLIDFSKISKNAAECFYLGIVHDTGVFKYSSCSRKTMEIAGALLELGVDAAKIIDGTFYKKTYTQNLLMAKTVLESNLLLSGKVISGVITDGTFKAFNATRMDTDGIVEQLRLTDSVEVAILCYQIGEKTFKYSLRSKEIVDCSIIATEFGGGGHVRAAGFEYDGPYMAVMNKIISRIEEQLKAE